MPAWNVLVNHAGVKLHSESTPTFLARSMTSSSFQSLAVVGVGHNIGIPIVKMNLPSAFETRYAIKLSMALLDGRTYQPLLKGDWNFTVVGLGAHSVLDLTKALRAPKSLS